MKEITSKLTGLIQVVTDDTWEWIVKTGRKIKYKVHDLPSRPLKDVPPVIEKTKTKTKK